MRIRSFLLASVAALIALPAAAQTTAMASAPGPDGRLFHAPLDTGYAADQSVGLADPLFVDQVALTPDGAEGGAVRAADAQILAWAAPGNLYAQRGTVSFFWRSHQPIGQHQFVIFRVGYPDHTSWDMTFLRLDWNGHGFDAFVTDANLARVRVSFDAPAPDAEAWTHLAVAWDETSGLTLYVDGKPAAKTSQTAVLDNGLFAFGPHSRIIAGYQVQSAYDYQRGGDVDEISTFDHRLGDAEVAALAAHQQPAGAPFPTRDMADPATQAEWRMRYGFNRPADPPPYLAAPSTSIRVVHPTEARDIRALFSKGDDGIRESTWPGVYNRSRLPGRHDYFVLPDWNVYEAGGKALTLTLPDQNWNRIEIQGAADGTLTAIAGDRETRIGTRPRGQERTTLQLAETQTGGAVRFDNRVQETPIREIGIYDVQPGQAPAGSTSLEYVVTPSAATTAPTLNELNRYIAGRFVPDERQTVVALPAGAPKPPRPDTASSSAMPLVHILIPADFRDVVPGGPPARFDYGWANMRDGLDGFAIQIPALTATSTHAGLIPLNIRIKDPIWPDRDLLDVNVSVRPGEARTLWLDTRDRFLPNDRSLYLSVASDSPDFGPASLDGMRIRLVFKPREQAMAEHVADREEQIKANLAWFVEEQPNNRLLPVYERFDREVTDLLRVDPDNVTARIYWNEQNGNQPYPTFVQTPTEPGVPLWAHRQIEDLKQVEHFVNWWIDHRQIPAGQDGAGEFGGGLSDDSDLLGQWTPLYLMGSNPEKMRASEEAALDAIYRSGMLTDGLNTIRADELHSYEEGINTVAIYAMMNPGSPRAIEQLMATARRYPEMTAVNAAGHRHFLSNSFSTHDFTSEGPWGRQKGNNFLMFHPGILLVQWNGAPATRDIILQTLDGFLAHGTPAPNGGVTLASPIDWTTDAASTATGALGNTTGAGLTGSTGAFWAGYAWTHDDKYLQPLLASTPAGLNGLGPDVMSILGKGDVWGPTFVATANQPDGYRPSNTGGQGSQGMARFGAWQTTGDTAYLEALYGTEIQSASQRMDMMTTGELWTDRVQISSEMLQRSRLGGVGGRRGQTFSGNVISWRFGAADGADSVAILVPEATPDHFKVMVFNTQDHPVDATLIGAGVTPGQWTLSKGIDTNGDNAADAPATSTINFETGTALPLTLPPKQTTVLEFRLAQAGTPMAQRPDVGLDARDVVVSGGTARVTVHGLGGVGSPAGEVRIETATGEVVSRSPFAALQAPADLLPKTETVRVALPRSARGLTVRLVLDGDPAEISSANNGIVLP